MGRKRQNQAGRKVSGWLNWQGWGALILLWVTLGIAVRCIEQSQWLTPQPSLLLVLTLAGLAGLLTAKIRLPAAAALALGTIIGGVVIAWQTVSLLPEFEATTDVSQLSTYLQSLWLSLSLSTPSESTLHFAVFLASLTWLIGYISTWFFVRKGNPWVGICLGTLAVLVNLSNLPGEHEEYFFLYFLAAGLLIGQSHLARQHHWFRAHGMKYSGWVMTGFLAMVVAFTVLVVGVAWSLPEVQANHLQYLVFGKVSWENTFEDNRMNVFAAVQSKWSTLTTDYQARLTFAAPSTGKDVQFIVKMSKPPGFWRTQRYDIYHPWGWTSSQTSEVALNGGKPAAQAESSSRADLTFKVVNKLKTDFVLAAGEFVSSNIPVKLKTLSPADSKDVFAVISSRTLKPGKSYTVRSSISTATPEQLSKAGEDYPEHITSHYLQLPPELPARVRQLSRMATRGAQTPYDRATAVVKFLAQYAYVQEGTAPPEGIDGVDYFLSVKKAGNCTNFASAMVVMLRAAGVPSRLSTGYLLRSYDASTGTALLRAADYHARAEVYFPGYGWVEFEATPVSGQADVEALDSQVAASGETGSSDGVEAPPATATSSAESDNGSTGSYALEEFPDGTFNFDAALPGKLWTNTIFRVASILLTLFALFAVFYLWLRRFNRADDPATVYARMCSLASLLKLRPLPQQTPLEYCARLASVFPAQAESIKTLTWSYLESRYGQRSGAVEKERLRRCWQRVSLAIFRRCLHLSRSPATP